MFYEQLSCIPSENDEDGRFIPVIFKKSGFDAEKTVKHEILSTSSETRAEILLLP